MTTFKKPHEKEKILILPLLREKNLGRWFAGPRGEVGFESAQGRKCGGGV